MKIILKQNIPSLGYKDDVVEVKSGYGRNYLIPQGLAIIASDAALKRLAEDQKQRAHKIAKIHEEAEAAAAALQGIKLTIPAKAAANGAVYGSVNAAHIAAELAKLGHEIDRKTIDVETVKMLGSYTATVRFLRDVNAEIEFDVVAEEEEA
ncbi:MAG: 50S ribosomal protein L9 [Candidatus Amulumruptor caecigallinarius]|nr:50S ribosomal protein L9 [Candidatus Amulumruptor caecigallinarius]